MKFIHCIIHGQAISVGKLLPEMVKILHEINFSLKKTQKKQDV